MPSYQPGLDFSISSGFGTRSNPNPSNPNPDYHPGIDFAAPHGTPVSAASDGTVVYSGYNQAGYGYTVIIQSVGADGSTYYTLYAHMQPSDLPSVGQAVASGDSIGLVGNTGLTFGSNDGNHLHFEVLTGDTPVNHSDGGPLGFSSNQTQYRYDPDQFNNWNGGSPYSGGLKTSGLDDLEEGDIAAQGGGISDQIVVATANGIGKRKGDRLLCLGYAGAAA